MEQLSAQARSDLVTIREHKEQIVSLHQQLETDKVGSDHAFKTLLKFCTLLIFRKAASAS